MQLPLVKKIDGIHHHLALCIPKKDGPDVLAGKVTYCCEDMEVQLTQGLFELHLDVEYSMSIIEHYREYGEENTRNVHISFCPFCGEKFTYAVVKTVKVIRKWIETPTYRVWEVDINDEDVSDS